MFSLGALWSALSGAPGPQGLLADREFEAIVTDSRQAVPGSLFVALRGERLDGHDYVADAFRRGAAAALVSRQVHGCGATWPVEGAFPSHLPAGPVCLLVPDVLRALQEAAAGWRRRHPACRAIGVTGSVGKTSTKEAIAAVLAQRYRLLKSEGNYNNEIGLPLTLLKLDTSHERAVLEMGMYGPGEIARLAEISGPAVGVVTNVGPVHLERLGSIEAIARAKAELPASLSADGTLVLNGDDHRVRAMASQTPASTVLTFGLGADCDVRAVDLESRGLAGIEMRFLYAGEAWPVRFPFLGRHNVYVALAAAAVGLVEGLSKDEIAVGLAQASPLGRMTVLSAALGSTVLSDTYNACPASTLADLNLLAELSGRRLAILGDMLELGAYEEEGHREVGRRAAEILSILVAVGPRARWIAEEAQRLNPGLMVRTELDRFAAAAWMRAQMRAGDYVLVKGSRGMLLEEIVPTLCKEAV